MKPEPIAPSSERTETSLQNRECVDIAALERSERVVQNVRNGFELVRGRIGHARWFRDPSVDRLDWHNRVVERLGRRVMPKCPPKRSRAYPSEGSQAHAASG